MNRFAPFLIALILTAGCGTTPPKAPSGPLETVEAIEVAAIEAEKKIAQQTCKQYQAGKCTDVGVTIEPEKAASYYKQVESVRDALKVSTAIAGTASGTGACLGSVRTQEQCIQAARDLLATVQANIR